MKLLFDQNLSHKLVALLGDLYPDSEHVRNVGLRQADDAAIWKYALAEGFTLVTKDEDFYLQGLMRGFPPKVIWLQTGNCITDRVQILLRLNHDEIAAFGRQSDTGCLTLL